VWHSAVLLEFKLCTMYMLHQPTKNLIKYTILDPTLGQQGLCDGVGLHG
jgi:hypothetical protein